MRVSNDRIFFIKGNYPFNDFSDSFLRAIRKVQDLNNRV